MNIRLVGAVGLGALVAGLAGTLFAETYDASTGYATLLMSDGKSGSNQYYSLTTNYPYHHWSDGLPFHAGTNYYIKAGLTA